MGRALDHLLVDGAHLRLAGFILHQLLKCALLITRRLISTERLIYGGICCQIFNSLRTST